MRALLFSHLRRKPRLLLVRFPSFSPPLPSPSVTPPPIRLLHGFPSPPKPDSFSSPPSRILQSITPVASELAEGDAAMNEFLSRFVWAVRGKLVDAYPTLSKETLDAMLLIICQKVIAEMEKAGDGAAAADPQIDLSEDLWKTIWEVSNSVHEAMSRERMREEIKKYIHCDEVKDMCHFAAEIGIRGPTLRELRFKWAREKLEEVEFYRSLDQMREQDKKLEEEEKALSSGSGVDPESCWVGGEKGGKTKVLALPQRKGKINYKIYGLDLSDPKWAEVAERVEEAEKHIVPEEPQPVDGKCKKVEEKLLALKAKRDDPTPLLAEWAELLQPTKVDWLALLDRIKQRNVDLYFKKYCGNVSPPV